MSSRWIVNASPLIVLARLEQADLLLRLPSELVIPAAVATEIAAGPVDDPGRQWLAGPGNRAIREDVTSPPSIAAWDLGRGETAVLAAGYRATGCTIVVDDHAARQCAKVFGLRTLGTVGVILLAKRRGLIPFATPLIRSLPKHGCHISQALGEAIRLAGKN